MATFDAAPELHELTLNEIFNGCAAFEGFCPIVSRCSSWQQLCQTIVCCVTTAGASQVSRRDQVRG